MQTKLPDGSVIVCGTCGKDPEFGTVGENQSRKCTVGLAVGKRANPDGGDRPVTIWCNVVAWHDLASLLAAARKGDPVFVVGRLKSREYNGKTYTDLEAEWLNVASVRTAVDAPPQAVVPGGVPKDPYEALRDDNGELPF